MPLTTLLLAAILGMGPADVETLVRQLGASKYAEREAAAEALEKLGPDALEALSKALGDNDLEIRNRARALHDRIERSTLLNPRRIRLDFKDETLSHIVEQVGNRTGLRLGMTPDLEIRARELRLTLESPEPVTFWRMTDQICSAVGLQQGSAVPSILDRTETPVVLQPKGSRAPAPTSDHGPFRVRLLGFHYQHDLNFEEPAVPGPRGRGADLDAEQFSVRMRVSAEPRLMVTLNGTPKILEARDDRGQSLMHVEEPGTTIRSTSFLGLNASATLEVQTNLTRPATPGTRLKILKGTIPVQVGARRSSPLSLPLTTPETKVQSDDASLRLVSIKPQAFNRQHLIEVAVRLPVAASGEVDAYGPRPGFEPHHFEVLDAQSRPIPWYLSSSTFQNNDARLILTTLPSGRAEAVAPAVLRYHSTVHTTTDIPFEFRDVRIP